jgi:hypothetical protein
VDDSYLLRIVGEHPKAVSMFVDGRDASVIAVVLGLLPTTVEAAWTEIQRMAKRRVARLNHKAMAA